MAAGFSSVGPSSDSSGPELVPVAGVVASVAVAASAAVTFEISKCQLDYWTRILRGCYIGLRRGKL